MKVLVIGGTLFVGKALVRSLLKAGHEVTVLHRRKSHTLGKKVENLTADRNDGDAVRAALAGKQFDVVFDNVYDWERGTTAAQVEQTVRACGDRLMRYVFMSSVAAYGDGLNHLEGDALAPDDHPNSYIRNKATTERMLFRLRQRMGLPVVTLRPPFIYGPENPFYREAFFWDRLRVNRPILVPGDGRRLMQFVYVEDVVTACLQAAALETAVGHAFNVANPRPVTQDELVQALAAAAGKKTDLVHVPRTRIHKAGGDPMKPPLYFGVYYDLPPITLITAKAQRMLKLKTTTFEEGLKATYRWYARNHKAPKADFTFEDAMLAQARATRVVVPG
jgi:nucleoside-diphosphate-sugar epimerase